MMRKQSTSCYHSNTTGKRIRIGTGTTVAVGAITAAGLMLDTVEVSALGAGALMVLTARGVEAEVWES